MSTSLRDAAELDRLIWYMRTVIQRSENSWDRNFAKSILKQSKRKTWQPSPKQIKMMHRLVDELFASSENLEVIE
ncbi:MAG: hypothetical protein AAGJ34_12915 [Pseudomonadota bacterium]